MGTQMSQDSHAPTFGPAEVLPSDHIAHRKPRFTLKALALLVALLALAPVAAGAGHMDRGLAAKAKREHMSPLARIHMDPIAKDHMKSATDSLAGTARADHMDP